MNRGLPRRLLLRWLFSRGRWINAVLVVCAFGVLFLLVPELATDVLGIRSSPEVAALFRLFGIALVSRGLLHHSGFGVADPKAVLWGLAADFAFALPMAVVLVFAIRQDLAGPATWAVVALFATEAMLYFIALAGLWSVTHLELETARRKRSDETRRIEARR